MAQNLYDDCYLVMSEFGLQRMTKRPGRLARGEIMIKVRVIVPTSCFTEPAISATVTVPESAIRHPEAEVEVLDANEKAD